MNVRQKFQIVGAIVLLFSMLPLPYVFYPIVRLVMTIVGGYLAYNYYIRNRKKLALVFLIIAVLFQPFVMLSFGRSIWLVIDVTVAIFFLLLVVRKK